MSKCLVPGQKRVLTFLTQMRECCASARRKVKYVAVLSFLIVAQMLFADRFMTIPVHAQSMQPQKAKSDKARATTPLERCIATWDRGTQMSKQEWRATCKRTVKEFPDLYAKPY